MCGWYVLTHTKECMTYNDSLALSGRSIEGECICDECEKWKTNTDNAQSV